MATASFIIIFTTGIFTQTGFSGSDEGVSIGKRCYIEKFLPTSAEPYQYQYACMETRTYENGTVINGKRTVYWCQGPNYAMQCIVYQPGGDKENAASEPAGNLGGSDELSTNLGSKNDSKVLGNDFPVIDDESKDTSQLKKSIPIGPLDSATTDEEDSADSNDDDNNKETNELKEEPNEEVDNNGGDDND